VPQTSEWDRTGPPANFSPPLTTSRGGENNFAGGGDTTFPTLPPPLRTRAWAMDGERSRCGAALRLSRALAAAAVAAVGAKVRGKRGRDGDFDIDGRMKVLCGSCGLFVFALKDA